MFGSPRTEKSYPRADAIFSVETLLTKQQQTNDRRCRRYYPTVLPHALKALDDMEELHVKRSNAGAIQDDEDETRRKEEQVEKHLQL